MHGLPASAATVQLFAGVGQESERSTIDLPANADVPLTWRAKNEPDTANTPYARPAEPSTGSTSMSKLSESSRPLLQFNPSSHTAPVWKSLSFTLTSSKSGAARSAFSERDAYTAHTAAGSFGEVADVP